MATPFRPNKPIEGPLMLYVAFHLKPPKTCPRKHPHCRPDLDNLIKAITDAMNETFWLDDAQIVCIHATKDYQKTASIEIAIGKIPDA